MVSRLVVVVLVAGLVAGCGHGSVSGSNPPADHGGYQGKAGHWYDVAYRSCYRQIGQLQTGPHSDGALLGTLLSTPDAAGSRTALDAGCGAGATKAGGVAGFMSGTYGGASTGP
jgi:hypothetical protein